MGASKFLELATPFWRWIERERDETSFSSLEEEKDLKKKENEKENPAWGLPKKRRTQERMSSKAPERVLTWQWVTQKATRK